jgi:hypothetical protein
MHGYQHVMFPSPPHDFFHPSHLPGKQFILPLSLMFSACPARCHKGAAAPIFMTLQKFLEQLPSFLMASLSTLVFLHDTQNAGF